MFQQINSKTILNLVFFTFLQFYYSNDLNFFLVDLLSYIVTINFYIDTHLFMLCFFILLITIVILFFLNNLIYIRNLTLFTVSLVFLLVSKLIFIYKTNFYHYQCVEMYIFDNSFLNFTFMLGVDGLSFFFIILSCFLTLLGILFIWDEKSFKFYAINLLFIEFFLIGVFSVLDLFLFYVFFEAILIPMFFVIGYWGSRERKIRALYLFFFYTLIGSLLMIIGIIYIYNLVGTLNIEYLSSINFSFSEQLLLWLAFFFSFSVKIPLFPFHIWLPEAHVEAPTIGSVLLAGILLKLGVYGFLRFSLFFFPQASLYFSPLIYLFSLLGIIYGSLCALRQTDFKRIIAYSSVAHMNTIMLGIFSFNTSGFIGSILQSLSHGFVASALFFIIGFIYNRYHSRSIFYYGGLTHVMPVYSIYFLFFILANIAMPGTSNFIGEFLILCSIYSFNIFACIISVLGVILSGSYSLWLVNRIIFGNINTIQINFFNDLSFREFFILFFLSYLTLLMGLYPLFFIDFIQIFSSNLYISSFY